MSAGPPKPPPPARGTGDRPAELARSVRWPLPPPGRVRYSGLLGLGIRRWLLRRRLRAAAPFLPRQPRVVDLGAGTGTDLEELRRVYPGLSAPRTILVEAQVGMLARVPPAVGRSAGTERVQADGARLPLRDASADLVLSFGYLCCVDDGALPRAVAESVRVLAPGGVLLLGVPRWRGRSDEALHRAAGLERLAGGRPGHAVYRRPPFPAREAPGRAGHKSL